MFQLRDKMRRRMCIAAFVCFGVIPSLWVGGWCVARHLPGRTQAEADALGLQWGLVVKLEAVKHLRPGAVLYEGIELADPETGRPIFRSRCLEVVRQPQPDWQGQLRPTLCVIASQPEVEAANLDLARRWMQRLMASRPGTDEPNLQFSAAEVTLRAGDRSQTLADVAALMEIQPGQTQAEIDFRLAGVATPEPARIRIVQNRGDCPDFRSSENGTVPFGVPTTRFELLTDANELPCSLLAIALGELNTFGKRCRFRGQIFASETPDGWDADVAGQLVELDLDSLVSDHFPHRLSGIGKATIRSAHFCRGRLEQCDGELVAGRGTVSSSLLKAAGEYLGLVPGEEPFPTGERIAYEELAIAFSLDTGGLRLRGLCTTAEPHTILSNGCNRLLGESARDRQPVAALVQTLAPQSALQVPVSRQTDWLLHHLPISGVTSQPGSETAPLDARLHLRDKWH
jgi:hypothetical protein